MYVIAPLLNWGCDTGFNKARLQNARKFIGAVRELPGLCSRLMRDVQLDRGLQLRWQTRQLPIYLDTPEVFSAHRQPQCRRATCLYHDSASNSRRTGSNFSRAHPRLHRQLSPATGTHHGLYSGNENINTWGVAHLVRSISKNAWNRDGRKRSVR
jgi:hypothetical protein